MRRVKHPCHNFTFTSSEEMKECSTTNLVYEEPDVALLPVVEYYFSTFPRFCVLVTWLLYR